MSAQVMGWGPTATGAVGPRSLSEVAVGEPLFATGGHALVAALKPVKVCGAGFFVPAPCVPEATSFQPHFGAALPVQDRPGLGGRGVRQFLGESLFFALLSLVCSLFLVKLLLSPFRSFVQRELETGFILDGSLLLTLAGWFAASRLGRRITMAQARIGETAQIACVDQSRDALDDSKTVREVVEVGRRHGIPVVVDGAHAFAHFPFTRDELGCDYYGTSLHKWTYAPVGTGFLYVKKDKIKDIWPLMAGEPGAENPHEAYFLYYGQQLQAVRTERWKDLQIIVLRHENAVLRRQIGQPCQKRHAALGLPQPCRKAIRTKCRTRFPTPSSMPCWRRMRWPC